MIKKQQTQIHRHEGQKVQAQLISMNKVLHIAPKESFKLFIVPAYLTMTILNIKKLDLEELRQEIECVFYLVINFNGLHESVAQLILKNISLTYNFIKNVNLYQNLSKFTFNQKEQMMILVCNETLDMKVTPSTFFTPFETIRSNITVTLNSITGKDREKNKVKVKFNLMDHERMQTKLFFKPNLYFKVYDLAQKKLKVQFKNQAKRNWNDFWIWETALENIQKTNQFIEHLQKKVQQKYQDEKCQIADKQKRIQRQNSFKLKQIADKIKSYKYANYEFVLYKIPNAAIIKIFVPFWLLGIISLGVFFQDNALSGRIGSITGLLIAFVAFIPAVKSEAPATPYITLVQLIFICEAISCFLCFIESINVRNETQFLFKWNQSWIFLLSLCITTFSILSVFILWLSHLFYYQPHYNISLKKEIQHAAFNRDDWRNTQCDQYFDQKIKELNCQYKFLNSNSEQKIAFPLLLASKVSNLIGKKSSD